MIPLTRGVKFREIENGIMLSRVAAGKRGNGETVEWIQTFTVAR